jgi:protein-S-isoprenylcysteine O-methyltransferase Ste14
MMFRMVIQLALWLLSMALVLIFAAGDPSWTAAWAFLCEVGLLSLAVGVALNARDPGLLAERLKSPFQRDQLGWDRRFMVAVLVGFYLWLALMGLDAWRLRWSHLPQPMQGVGVLLVAATFAVSWLTFRANHFAVTTVKLQAGQSVIDSGPYTMVRHPMYAGAMAFFIGVPLMLGSWVGLALAPLFIVAMATRAIGEERLLHDKLPGYADYAARVRYRFVPKVW